MGFNKGFFRFGKKGFIISESIVIPFALLLVGISIYMASGVSVAANKNFEGMAPELSYEYPKTVVYSFLNFPISSNHSNLIFGNNNSDYRVYDLIYVNTDESKKLVDFYRSDFLAVEDYSFTNQLDYFYKFSSKRVEKSDLIYINYNPGLSSSLEDVMKKKNFFMRVPKSSGGETLVFFSKVN